jgi:regulator of replication initiation timing
MITLTLAQTRSMVNENYAMRTEINRIKSRLEEVNEKEEVVDIVKKMVARDIDRMEDKIRKNNLIMSTVVTDWDS